MGSLKCLEGLASGPRVAVNFPPRKNKHPSFRKKPQAHYFTGWQAINPARKLAPLLKDVECTCSTRPSDGYRVPTRGGRPRRCSPRRRGLFCRQQGWRLSILQRQVTVCEGYIKVGNNVVRVKQRNAPSANKRSTPRNAKP